MKERPAHDDLLDVVTMALDKLKIPADRNKRWGNTTEQVVQLAAHSKFGGRRR